MMTLAGRTLFLIAILASVGSAADIPAAAPTPDLNKMSTFEQNLPKELPPPANAVEKLILSEYGAVFVARGNVTPPKSIVFRDGAEVDAFQTSIETMTENIEGVPMTLQAPAMRALINAVREASSQNLTISPRDTDAASRNYSEAVGLWASRVEPALDHWTAKGKMTQQQAERIRSLAPFDQVSAVLDLEKRGIYFAKDLNKSIIYSVAPPGTSQHLSMLAFDVAEHGDPRIRMILGKHGWFQTVVSDLPHFTYLGVSEVHLPQLGLKKRMNGGRVFWLPEL